MLGHDHGCVPSPAAPGCRWQHGDHPFARRPLLKGPDVGSGVRDLLITPKQYFAAAESS